jgi:DNA-binding NarL/FixJ family response regulator
MKDAHPIRIILVDNHPIVRSGIRAELEKLDSVEVVGEADDGRAALALVQSQKPQVVFMDISMPGLNGLEATARITKEFSGVRVVILSRHEDAQYFWHALKAGASGYLLKRGAITEMSAAIHRVMNGEIYLSRQISAQLVKKLPQQIAQSDNPVQKLTSRQREILQLIAEGQTTKAIALILKVSPKTIEYHRAKLMERLNIFDIPGLVRFALRAGMIAQET